MCFHEGITWTIETRMRFPSKTWTTWMCFVCVSFPIPTGKCYKNTVCVSISDQRRRAFISRKKGKSANMYKHVPVKKKPLQETRACWKYWCVFPTISFFSQNPCVVAAASGLSGTGQDVPHPGRPGRAPKENHVITYLFWNTAARATKRKFESPKTS